jgi:hypothetical protein
VQVPKDLRKGHALVKLCQPLHEGLSLSLVSRVKEVEKPLSGSLWAAPAIKGLTVACIASFDVGKGCKSNLYVGAQIAQIALNQSLGFGCWDA